LDDGLFPAHKVLVAARSKYFKAMFTGGMQHGEGDAIAWGSIQKLQSDWNWKASHSYELCASHNGLGTSNKEKEIG